MSRPGRARVSASMVNGHLNCDTNWGSHGCDRPRGHRGAHACGDCCECARHPDPDSGCVATWPYYGWRTRFYGDDAPGRTGARLHWLACWLRRR